MVDSTQPCCLSPALPQYATTASGLTYPPSELCILSGNEEQSYGQRGFIMNMPLSLASGIFFPSSLQFSSGFIVFEGKHVRISQPALVLLPFACIIQQTNSKCHSALCCSRTTTRPVCLSLSLSLSLRFLKSLSCSPSAFGVV